MDQRIGVYIDTGYGIGEALDIPNLCSVARDGYGVVVCRVKAYWNDPNKLAVIRNDIAEKGLTTVIIAGPSPQGFQEEFKFESVITEWINLREHVASSLPTNDKDAQMLAEDYIRRGIAKTAKD
jgi:quinone-modifying oxidoreductase subunit QmoB